MTVASVSDVYDILARLAAHRPDAMALVGPRGKALTFRGLHEATAATATRLKREGMQTGDPVLFSVRPSIEAIVLILATVRAGGTIVAADPGMGAELFARRMATVQPRFVMAETLLYALSASRIARRVLKRRGLILPQVGKLPGCRFVRVGRRLPGTPRSLDAARLMRPLPQTDGPVPLAPAAAVFVVFTAGTTADPRAVVHTDRSLSATIDMSLAIGALDSSSVVLTDQLHSAIPALLAGGRVVLPPIGTDAAKMARLLHRHAVTHTFAVPSDLHRLVTQFEQSGGHFPTSLRHIVLGAGPVDRPLLMRLRPLLPAGTEVRSFYALTEMPLVAQVGMEEKLAWTGEGDLVGTPIPGALVRIGDGGELYVGGDRLCDRYLGGEPIEEAGTGDLARIEEGRLVLLGRSKDMIIRGRYNIYPALYEDRIAALPGVGRCALVGVWDDRVGDERVVLVIEPEAGAPDPQRLKHAVGRALDRENLIDRLAMPDEIVVMSLPESGRTRKVDRGALRRLLAAKPA